MTAHTHSTEQGVGDKRKSRIPLEALKPVMIYLLTSRCLFINAVCYGRGFTHARLIFIVIEVMIGTLPGWGK